MFKADENNKNLHYLEDDKGNRRIQIGLDQNGEPFLEFLREDGTSQWKAINRDLKEPIEEFEENIELQVRYDELLNNKEKVEFLSIKNKDDKPLDSYFKKRFLSMLDKENDEYEFKESLKYLQNSIDLFKEEFPEVIGELSDGYHTYNELYEFRKMYNAVLFNEWARLWRIGEDDEVTFNVHKSWKHHDGKLCFDGGWFIVSAMLPTGLISNHYKAEDWDLFKVPEVEKALFEFDHHTGQDVLERLKNL